VDDSSASEPALRGRLLRVGWHDRAPDARRYEVRAGAQWRLQLRVRAPRGLRNPGGSDSEKYALAQRLAASAQVRPGGGDALGDPHGLAAWRESMSERIDRALPESRSRFVRALALGDTRALDDRDWHVLRANGLTHLIAISGFHVGLVAAFFALLARGLWWMLPGLGRRLPLPVAAALAALFGAFVYAAVAGFALPTVRTALMIAVVALARVFRRPSGAGDSLALAAAVIVLADPLSLLGAGFWLSFAGVAWLLWCLPRASAGSAAGVARDFASAQAVATVGLLPLGVLLFGQASAAGPLANLVAVPWWSLVVVPLSLAGLGLETLADGAGAWAWRAAGACFEASWPLFEWLERTGLALYWLPEAPWFAAPLALVGAFWLLLPRRVPGRALATLLWLPLLWPDMRAPAHGEAELTMIDVGQGLSVLVRTANHRLLYDMGPAVRDGFDAGERAVVPALHALGVTRLDRAIVSHGDNDHAGGFDAVRRALPLGEASAPEGSGIDGASPCTAGQRWVWDGVVFRMLHPTAHFPYLGNEASCVLRIEAAGAAALLTGDIGEVIERMILARDAASVRADLVFVAHHGSSGSSDPAFVDATGARHAMVSSGYGNRFRHPRPEVVERWGAAGATVHDTAGAGAVRA
ncbi:MAG TPA: DNA internalization-related competence protein ComEC/Rec2, partial [Lysobacter sp.]